MIERFFRDECRFGPRLKVSRSELYGAWEAWCLDEGEHDMGKTLFSRTMKDRGAVKGFVEGKSNGARVWKGIGLAEKDGGVVSPDPGEQSENRRQSDPDTPPKRESDPVQKSCKHGGIVDRQGHFTPDSQEFSISTPREGEPLEKRRKVTLVTLLSLMTSFASRWESNDRPGY